MKPTISRKRIKAGISHRVVRAGHFDGFEVLAFARVMCIEHAKSEAGIKRAIAKAKNKLADELVEFERNGVDFE